MSTKNDMYQDATRIYMAGIEAVKPANLVRQAVKIDKASNAVSINGNTYQLNRYVNNGHVSISLTPLFNAMYYY